MDLLGPSLEHYLNRYKKFSLNAVIAIAHQLITRLRIVHRKHLIHRDIKPENILTSPEANSNLVYLIDYGLGKLYRNRTTHIHIPYVEDKNLTGTARYASSNCHKGIQSSRRDDLENLYYVLLHLLIGRLPW